MTVRKPFIKETRLTPLTSEALQCSDVDTMRAGKIASLRTIT